MKYIATPIPSDIEVESLVTVHYFEYPHDFNFVGEAHDFWEFLYVDKGEVEVTADAEKYLLKKGDIIFHKPMEFHRLCAIGTHSPNLIVVSFYSLSPAMRFFENRILRLGDTECDLLAVIVKEARAAFSTPLDDPYLEQMVLRDPPRFGSLQLCKLSLETLLIRLARRQPDSPPESSASAIRRASDSDTLSRVSVYLENHVRDSLTLDDICRDNLIGRSSLQKLFRAKTGGGVMEYFSRLKIETAKQYIRDGHRNFTEIAHSLGFSTIHYFSRRFKSITGMTPTEYASSVKMWEEDS